MEPIKVDLSKARALEVPAPEVVVEPVNDDAEFAAYKENYLNTSFPDPRKYRNDNVTEEQRDAWLRTWFITGKYGFGSPETKAAWKKYTGRR